MGLLHVRHNKSTTEMPINNSTIKPAAAAAAVAESSKRRKSPDSVVAIHNIVEILDDDDDDNEKKPAASVATMEPAMKRPKMDGNVIAVNGDDVIQVSSVAVGIGAKNLFATAAAAEGTSKKPSPPLLNDDDDDDVLVVEAPTQELCPVAARVAPTSKGSCTNSKNNINAKNDDDDDDDIEMLGCKNQCHLPHLRQHCTEKTFVPLLSLLPSGTNVPALATGSPSAKNVDVCDLCYCYVCDAPVKDCKRWSSTSNVRITHNHCHASEQGPTSAQWTKLREMCKNHKGDWTKVDEEYQNTLLSSSSAAAASASNRAAMDREDERIFARMDARFRRHLFAGGPNTTGRVVVPATSQRRRAAPKAPTRRQQRAMFLAQQMAEARASLVASQAAATARAQAAATAQTQAAAAAQAAADTAQAAAAASTAQAPFAATVITTGDTMTALLARQGQDKDTDVKPPPPTSHLPTVVPDHLQKGFFLRTDTAASKYLHLLTKCRKCEYYSYTSNMRRTPNQVCRVEGTAEEWCQACGRVAPIDFTIQKNQCQTYQPKPTDVLLGSKTIPFTIRTHDPRQMEAFKALWAKNENKSNQWKYSAAEMEKDMFYHRIGTYPTLEMILKAIPVVRPDKIPKDGVRTLKELQDKPCMDDTNAIIMDRNSQIIFQELFPFKFIGYPKNRQEKNSMVVGDIRATWNAQQRRGEFVVRVFFNPKGHTTPMTRLLGAWFGMSAFPLSKLAGRITASSMPVLLCYHNHIPVPPYTVSATLERDCEEQTRDEMAAAVKTFNESATNAATKLSLQSSLGSSSLLGGICPTDHSFGGMLVRYYTEMLPEQVVTRTEGKRSVSWLGRALGITSHHRSMRHCTQRLFADPTVPCNMAEQPNVTIESYVRDEDLPLCENLQLVCKTIVEQTKSMKGLLLHLENLGHGDSPFVEGLNVELLPFQRQTLQWALERETTPGGVQSYLWSRLPVVEDSKSPDVYFNPILNKVTTTKPKLVRGGIIADEMGLGKTVVSLGLILQNPAPLLPASGTRSDQVTHTAVVGDGWDPNFVAKGTSGSVLSRGTLVVCHLSLVGQWIEEAKFKLTDPGLVYAYHGGNRKRDPMILAQNSIVVTTYATLSSDKFYKGYHGGRDDYVPPCEQVRWWRIICDESHTLKTCSKQRQTIFNLVGDHKWAVSGTPWNSSLMDVKGQLQFVGIENIDEMFQDFSQTVLDHIGEKQPKHSYQSVPGESRKFGHFTFLMRAVMIRHAQQQQYQGTSTTLMSLPPKSERSIEIEFVGAEAEEYAKLSKEAVDFYIPFRATHYGTLSSHYLKLIQKLTPLRVACAGGRIPLNSDEGEEGDDLNGDGSKKRKEKQFSEFAFHSKSVALIKELERVRDEDPTSKSLIFSQYASSLKFLQEELPKHGFQFRTLSGDMSLKKRAEALYKFQKDPPTTIFLLSMRSGAVGINLTQANRVFMLEPAMNPALEAQAIGRVYRLGQTRPVEIVRLLMKDSVETRMRSFLDNKYGTAQKQAASDDCKGDSEEPSTDPVSNAIVGSLRTDRAALMEEEFDLLFGVDESAVASHAVAVAHSHLTIMPDLVGSENVQSGCI